MIAMQRGLPIPTPHTHTQDETTGQDVDDGAWFLSDNNHEETCKLVCVYDDSEVKVVKVFPDLDASKATHSLSN